MGRWRHERASAQQTRPAPASPARRPRARRAVAADRPPARPATASAPTADLFGRQLEVLQAAVRPPEPGGRTRGRRSGGRRGDRPDHRLPQRPGLRPRGAGDLVPIAFEGRVGAYAEVDFDLLRTTLGFGFTGWVGLHGEPLLVRDANADPRGASIPGTDDVDESMLVVPMRYDDVVVGVITLSKLGLDQFDGHDLRLLSILADQAATALESARQPRPERRARRRAAPPPRREQRARGAASTRARSRTSLPATWRASWASTSAGSRGGTGPTIASPASATTRRPAGELKPFFDIATYPLTRRVLDDQIVGRVDVTATRTPIPRRSALLEGGGQSLARDAAARREGRDDRRWSELISRGPIEHDEERLGLARTIANEASIALENARLYGEARALADRDPLTGFFNHRYAPRAVRPGGRPGPADPSPAQPADARPRRLQARQRHLRAPARRRGPALDRRD